MRPVLTSPHLLSVLRCKRVLPLIFLTTHAMSQVGSSTPSSAEDKARQAQRPPRVRPGDWVCPSCGANVFASKANCYKCAAPKPFGTEVPVAAQQGRGGGRIRGRGGRADRGDRAAAGEQKTPQSPGGGGFLGLSPSKVPIVDIGINLMHKSFAKTLDDVVKRSVEAGVTTLVITGTSEPASIAALNLAKTYKLPDSVPPASIPSHPRLLYSTAGVHPHDAKHWTEGTRTTLRKLLTEDGKGIAVAVGECGLDFNRNFSPQPVQEQVFREQVLLAVELGLPLFCHEREAHPAFVSILDSIPGAEKVPVCVHCFTGSEAELREYVRRGYYVGFTGCICDERRGKALRPLVGQVPLERLLIETDAPFMMPTGGRGRNEPANLVAVLRTAAECHGVTEEAVAKATTENAIRFFQF